MPHRHFSADELLEQIREETSALEGVIAVGEPYEDSFFGYIIAVQILPECCPTLASRIPSQVQGIPVKINPALQLIEKYHLNFAGGA